MTVGHAATSRGFTHGRVSRTPRVGSCAYIEKRGRVLPHPNVSVDDRGIDVDRPDRRPCRDRDVAVSSRHVATYVTAPS